MHKIISNTPIHVLLTG